MVAADSNFDSPPSQQNRRRRVPRGNFLAPCKIIVILRSAVCDEGSQPPHLATALREIERLSTFFPISYFPFSIFALLLAVDYRLSSFDSKPTARPLPSHTHLAAPYPSTASAHHSYPTPSSHPNIPSGENLSNPARAQSSNRPFARA